MEYKDKTREELIFELQYLRNQNISLQDYYAEEIKKRVLVEKDLQVILAKYKVLFEILPIGLTITDPSGKILESNQIAETLLGISREEQEKPEIDGQEWRIIRPDNSTMPVHEFASVQALAQDRLVPNEEMGIIKSGNQVTWLNVSAIPIPIEGHGVAIVYNDITRRKQTERENERIQKLLEDSQRIGKIGSWEFNTETQELTWTKEMYNIHEVDSSFIPSVDKRVNFYTPESQVAVDNAVKQAIEGNGSYELVSEIITAKGNRRVVKSIGIADREQKRIYGLFQDITESKRAEESLQKSEEKYRNLFENSQIGMFRTRIDGSEILDVNNKLLEITGFPREEMLSNPSTIRYSNLEQRTELLILLKQKGSVSNFEVEMFKKDNSLFTALLSVIIYPEEGILEGSFVDISSRKLAEKELIRSEAILKELNATKDKFFSIVAHDLKAPFNAILGFSDILYKEARNLSLESIIKYTGLINSSANQTYKLLENLLDWARMNNGNFPFEPKIIFINHLIKNEIGNMKYIADQKNIALNYLNEDNIEITADQIMISSVLRNLISNAVKFTPKSGTVNIESSTKNGQVVISISDTGVGIKQDTIENLFKIDTSFSTRGTENEKGTGLGLLLCREFIEKHSGTIGVESEPGKGSRFWFCLPK
jgi:PAS domain S-box-containing protein